MDQASIINVFVYWNAVSSFVQMNHSFTHEDCEPLDLVLRIISGFFQQTLFLSPTVFMTV